MKSQELIHIILARTPGAVSLFLLCLITQGFEVDRALAPCCVILGKLLTPLCHRSSSVQWGKWHTHWKMKGGVFTELSTVPGLCR